MLKAHVTTREAKREQTSLTAELEAEQRKMNLRDISKQVSPAQRTKWGLSLKAWHSCSPAQRITAFTFNTSDCGRCPKATLKYMWSQIRVFYELHQSPEEDKERQRSEGGVEEERMTVTKARANIKSTEDSAADSANNWLPLQPSGHIKNWHITTAAMGDQWHFLSVVEYVATNVLLLLLF